MFKCILAITRKLFLAASILFLFSCSSNVIKNEPTDHSDVPSLLRDDLVLQGAEIEIDTPRIGILQLDDHIRNHLDTHIRPIPNNYRRITALNKFILSNISTGESFQELQTKTALQTFYSKKANCLSYANLFIAAARYVGLDVGYHMVYVPPTWLQEKNSWILNHHINVLSALEKPIVNSIQFYNVGHHKLKQSLVYERKKYLFDINDSYSDGMHRGKLIPDKTAHAYFYSNMAAEALVENKLKIAYLYTKKAITTDATASNSWNTLGLIYNRLNHLKLSEMAFKYAYSINNEELSALSNLTRLYIKHGDHKQARKIARILHNHKQQNPYHHFTLAQNSYRNARYADAISHLNRAIKLKDTDAQFYLSKAQSYLQLKKYKKAEQSLRQAHFHALPENKERYYAKFERLNSLSTKQKEAM